MVLAMRVVRVSRSCDGSNGDSKKRTNGGANSNPSAVLMVESQESIAEGSSCPNNNSHC